MSPYTCVKSLCDFFSYSWVRGSPEALEVGSGSQCSTYAIAPNPQVSFLGRFRPEVVLCLTLGRGCPQLLPAAQSLSAQSCPLSGQAPALWEFEEA